MTTRLANTRRQSQNSTIFSHKSKNKTVEGFFNRKNISDIGQNFQHSINNRHNSKLKKSTSKNKVKNKKVGKFFIEKTFLFNHQPQVRKAKEVKYIPDTIVFKQKSGFRNSDFLSKTQKLKKRKQRISNKQNIYIQNQNHNIQQFITNKDLLKLSLKPNRINFMNRVSNIYDLLVSHVALPQFIEYFLGQAMFTINKESKIQGNKTLPYDWKLDQFKKACQKIYQNSQEEDLKHFMSLTLPSTCKWNSHVTSIKTNQSVQNNTFATTQTDSRVSYALSRNSNQDRLNYFKSLNKKQINNIKDQKGEIDILDKLNYKLDKYIENFHIPKKQQKNGYRRIIQEKKNENKTFLIKQSSADKIF